MSESPSIPTWDVMLAALAEDERTLSLPFDEYQRYQVASQLVTLLEVPAGGAVLDIGDGPELAQAFLSGRDVAIIDQYGSESEFPFAERSFAVGLALDVLEYIDARTRTHLVGEMCRLCDVVVICAPFSDPTVRLAETALHECVVQRFASEFPPRARRSSELPDLQETVAALERQGWATATLPCGYLPHWLAGMLLNHELLATGTPELPSLNAFYNATVSPFDCREPSYRHVVLAARELPAARLE